MGPLSQRHFASSGCGWRRWFQIYRIAANILSKQSWAEDKGWPSGLGLGEGYKILTMKNEACYEYYKGPRKKRQVADFCEHGNEPAGSWKYLSLWKPVNFSRIALLRGISWLHSLLLHIPYYNLYTERSKKVIPFNVTQCYLVFISILFGFLELSKSIFFKLSDLYSLHWILSAERSSVRGTEIRYFLYITWLCVRMLPYQLSLLSFLLLFLSDFLSMRSFILFYFYEF
jgi:hypothetical protein